MGVVGLGAGTIAAYARKGDSYRFYEINPEVDRFAGTARQILHLSERRRRSAGRRSMSRWATPGSRWSASPPQKFDILALDAFSGDAIPFHLLTREAFAVYRRHLAPGGVIAVHITNSYLYLAPVVRGIAQDAGLDITRIYISGNKELDRYRSDWMLLTKDAGLLKALPVELARRRAGQGRFLRRALDRPV